MKRLPRLWFSDNEAVLYIMLALILIGAINIFSASFVQASKNFHDSYFFIKRHGISFLLGLGALFFMSALRYQATRYWIPIMYVGSLALLTAVHFIGVEVNGARRWINIGFQFQPSELAKVTAFLLTAAYLGSRVDRSRPISLLSVPLLFIGVLFVFVMKQPDMGTAVIVIGISLLQYIVAGIPREQLLLLIGGGGGAFAYLAMAASYRADRIAAWLDPWAYSQGIGYQSVQGLLAIGSGGFLGTGFGMGASKFLYLPEAHTDFAYAVLCQEMGFLGALAVIALFALLAYYGVRIAMKAPDGFGKMLAIGVLGLIVGQAIINIAMVSGLAPVVGVPLPFISFGGTSLIVNMAAIGMLLNIGRQGSRVQTVEGDEGDLTQAEASRNTRIKMARQKRALNRVK